MPENEKLNTLANWLNSADAVLIGAGAGLSTAAGYTYSGERFKRYFSDFIEKYGFTDMYTGGFYGFPTKEEFWAYWSRYIWINRYMDMPGNLYQRLLKLVCDKEYFVLTTNVDHCFQRAGFDKKRLFYTQGDYGLFQCSKPCCKKTWDNRQLVKNMLESQGWTIGDDNALTAPAGRSISMQIAPELKPVCPVCGRPLTMNLRSDDRFVEDEGWHKAAEAYSRFISESAGKRLLLFEIGVGYNTPGIIKFNFQGETYRNENARYACLNLDDAEIPGEIAERSVGIEGDSGKVIDALLARKL